MSKYLCRLAQAYLHPGVAVLRRLDTGDTLLQFPMSEAKNLLGNRFEAFYLVTYRDGTYHLDQDIPRENLDAVQTELLGGEPIPRGQTPPTSDPESGR